MSGNKNPSKLSNSCLSGHLAQICKTHGRNAVLQSLHVRNPKDRDLKLVFFFLPSPFSQLCLICSCGLSRCQICYRSVPPGRQCFNSLPWCWVLTFRMSRKSRQDVTGGGTCFVPLDPPQIFTASFEGQFTLKEFYCILHRAAPLFPIPLPSKGRPPALNQTTCEINITLTHVSNSWCQSQTERVKRKKEEKLQKAFEVVWESVNASVRFSFFRLELAHLLISASCCNLQELKWL